MRYRCLNGLNYRPSPEAEEVRREAGDVIDDYPEDAVAEALAHGDLEPVNDEG